MLDINDIKIKKPFIIAGPCAIESEEQIRKLLDEMSYGIYKKIGDKINLFRAALWKPRTSLSSFQGLGKGGFELLKNISHPPLIIEVGNKEHVALSISNGINNLWVGARTTSNPFAVQEIADILKTVIGKDEVWIFIKNPVNPDIETWIGAIERINKAGIKNIIAIHRGFSINNNTYRNDPMWEIPIELKRRIKNIKIITDPSHICGKRKDLIYEISQTAMDLDFDGLMVEVHQNPDIALSDKEQQLTGQEFIDLISKLEIRDINNSMTNELMVLRSKINDLDKELINVLSKRCNVSRKIGDYKKEKNITIFQKTRWSNLLNEILKESKNLNLNESFIKKIFELIHKESIFIQEEMIHNFKGGYKMQKKQLTKDEVLRVMKNLIEESGEITNLGIKKQLRNEGFYATQIVVSSCTDQIYMDGELPGLEFTFNGTYRTYFIDDSPDDNTDQDDITVQTSVKTTVSYKDKVADWEAYDKDDPTSREIYSNTTRGKAKSLYSKEYDIPYIDVRAVLK